MKTTLNFWENTILNNINLDGYELQSPQKHIKFDKLNNFDKVQSVYNIFKDEYLHANNKHLGAETLFCEWLQGLPNCLSVPYMNYEILENAKKYGAFNLVTEMQKENFLNNYWPMLAKSFFNLSIKL
jgi:hypothetical protein